MLVCRQGLAIRSFPMEVVSNSAFTTGELQRFEQSTRSAGMPFLTVGAVRQKLQELKTMENYTYTPEEVAAIVAQKERERANRRPINAALDRQRCIDQIKILKEHMAVDRAAGRSGGGSGLSLDENSQPDGADSLGPVDDLDAQETNQVRMCARVCLYMYGYSYRRCGLKGGVCITRFGHLPIGFACACVSGGGGQSVIISPYSFEHWAPLAFVGIPIYASCSRMCCAHTHVLINYDEHRKRSMS